MNLFGHSEDSGAHGGRAKLRRAFVVFAVVALALAGCGFQPMYARGGPNAPIEIMSQIEVEPIANRSGQILRNHLIDMFDPLRDTRNKRFVLRARVTETPQVLALRRDDVISRGGYSATVVYSVVDRSGRVQMSGSAGFTADFEISDSERATSIARESARDRLMLQLAEEIRIQVAARAGEMELSQTGANGRPAAAPTAR